MQYVFFNNDSRFYKINVFKFTKGYFYTRDLRDSMCLVVRSNFAKVTPPPSPPPSDAYGRHSYISVPCMLT